MARSGHKRRVPYDPTYNQRVQDWLDRPRPATPPPTLDADGNAPPGYTLVNGALVLTLSLPRDVR